jgi:hypothetical protein
MRGVEKEELMQHFEKIDEINENINKMLDENPGSKVKEIKISYLDDDKKKIHFDINIEVNKG